MNVVRYWAVFALGVAAGAAAALIYAPQTGEKTRKQLKRHLEDASDYIKDASDDLSKHATRVYKTTKDVAGDVASRVSSVAEQRQLRSQQHRRQGRGPGLAKESSPATNPGAPYLAFAKCGGDRWSPFYHLDGFQSSFQPSFLGSAQYLLRHPIAGAQGSVHSSPMAADVGMLAGEEERCLHRNRELIGSVDRPSGT